MLLENPFAKAGLGEKMSRTSWERKAEKYLREQYSASEGWEINPQLDLGGHRPAFVLIRDFIRKERPEEIVYVEVEDVPVLRNKHVHQLAEYMRQCRFKVDYGIILCPQAQGFLMVFMLTRSLSITSQ